VAYSGRYGRRGRGDENDPRQDGTLQATGSCAGMQSPHVAHGVQPGLEGLPRDGQGGAEPRRLPQEQNRPACPESVCTGGVADTQTGTVRPGLCQDEPERERGRRSGDQGGPSANWPPEPNVGRVAHGVPNRVDRLRSLGNAIVPQVAAEIMWAMKLAR